MIEKTILKIFKTKSIKQPRTHPWGTPIFAQCIKIIISILSIICLVVINLVVIFGLVYNIIIMYFIFCNVSYKGRHYYLADT